MEIIINKKYLIARPRSKGKAEIFLRTVFFPFFVIVLNTPKFYLTRLYRIAKDICIV